MNAELVSELESRAHLTARARIVAALGPLTALGGIVWALIQPDRVTVPVTSSFPVGEFVAGTSTSNRYTSPSDRSWMASICLYASLMAISWSSENRWPGVSLSRARMAWKAARSASIIGSLALAFSTAEPRGRG